MSINPLIASDMLEEAKAKLNFDNKISVDTPQLVILGGQPGSGKSSAIEIIEAQFNGNIISVNGDDFKTTYPGYDDMLALDPIKTGEEVQPYSNYVVNELKRELSDKKYNMLIEGTMRTSEVPLSTLNEFKDKGYQTEAYVVASNYYASRTGCLLRREIDSFNTGSGRVVPVDSHDAAYNNIPNTLTKLIDSGKLDNLTIMSRSGQVLGSLNTGDDIVSIYKTHRNQLTPNEFNQVNSDLDRVTSMMQNRDAPAIEVSQVNELQNQLKINYGIDQTLKNDLLSFMQKEVNLGIELANRVKSSISNPQDKGRIAESISKITQDIKELCNKISPELHSQIEGQGIELKPMFGQQIDYNNIQQRLISNKLNQNDIANLTKGVEKRIIELNSQISLNPGKAIKL